MSLFISVTMGDCTDEEWTYELQYLGKITRVVTPMPIEAMSVLEQESFFSNLLQAGFSVVREQKLLKRPEDLVEEALASVESEDYDDDEEDGMDIYDVLTNLVERMEDLETFLGRDKPDTE